MPSEFTQIAAMVNLGICLAIIWQCIMGLTGPACQRCRLARLRWTLLLVAAQANGLQPLFFQTWADGANVVFSAAVLVHLVLRSAGDG